MEKLTPSICVILPTIGRNSLPRALESLRCQTSWGSYDELVFWNDGASSFAKACFDLFQIPGTYRETKQPIGAWGHMARNRILSERIPNADLICTLDDDDMLAPGAFDAFRTAAIQHPCQPLLFRLRYPDGGLIWKEPELRRCNIGTANCVFYNSGKWGRFDTEHDSDFDFVAETIEQQGGEPAWIDCVTYFVG